MKCHSRLHASVVGLIAACLILTAFAPAARARETTLYRFANMADGFGPQGLVTDSVGNLYGTTYLGGPNNACYQGCGTVYELIAPTTPGGKWSKSTIHAFNTDGVDGYTPTPVLEIDANGNLFGTTYFGGAGNGGAIYELSPPQKVGGSWSETILFSFNYLNNGANGNIAGSLLPFGGGYYTTTFSGGAFQGGTVDQLTPGHGGFNETVLYSFDRGRNGRPPGYDLHIDSRGDLYGVRLGEFGVCSGDFPRYCGNVYRLKPPSSPGGAYRYQSLHDFQGAGDGWFPNDDLVFDKKGDIFGTAQLGGGYAQGIVFELVPNGLGKPWAEYILNSFGLMGDYSPLGGVVFGKFGHMFGTTSGNGNDGGAVYQLSQTTPTGPWTESILYKFSGGSDGDMPNDTLIFGHDGALYGTTYAGGTGPCTYYATGCGVVFRITP